MYRISRTRTWIVIAMNKFLWIRVRLFHKFLDKYKPINLLAPLRIWLWLKLEMSQWILHAYKFNYVRTVSLTTSKGLIYQATCFSQYFSCIVFEYFSSKCGLIWLRMLKLSSMENWTDLSDINVPTSIQYMSFQFIANRQCKWIALTVSGISAQQNEDT